MKKRRAEPAPRVRRTADEARERILQAADARLLAHGPAALRLQELAADVGISHPTILHHFGSREALVREVLGRRMRAFQDDLVRAVTAEPFDEASATEVLRRAIDAFTDSGTARLFAFVALESPGGLPEREDLLVRGLAEAVHGRRVQRHGEAPYEDTLFVVLSVAMAVFADGLLGEAGWSGAGLAPGARARFRDWLLARANERLEAGKRLHSRR